MRKRIIIVIYISIFLLSLVVIRLGYITFYLSNQINPLAYDLWSREIPMNSSRGLILDRNGKVIVGNELCYTVCSINKQVKDKEDTANKLSSILGVSSNKILEHLNKNNSIEIIKPEGRKIDEEKALQIARLNISGIYLTCDSKRSYPYGTSLAQVLGFTGIDNEGLSGVEYMYDEYLKSQTGALKIYTDAKGNLMHDMIMEFDEPIPGMNICLTIDIELQMIMDNVIEKSVSMYNPDKVMGLILNAKTGEVLAMSSYPFYDPANYQDYSSEIINRNLPIFYQFELGSTFKIITYAAAYDLGLFDLNDTIYCSGSTVVGDRKIRCWKSAGHGSQTLVQGIENSCNVCFMELGRRLGVDNFYKYLEKFGMTEKTGIDLAGEGSPIIQAKKTCGPVELATQAFGHTSAYTPIQLSMAAIAAINGGHLLTPYILSNIETYAGTLVYEKKPKIKKDVITEKTSNIMKYVLESVVAKGTGRNAFVEGGRIGGKTGVMVICGAKSILLELGMFCHLF